MVAFPCERSTTYLFTIFSQGLSERGEKLDALEDRTRQMRDQAEHYSRNAHALAQKFKDKKWYQF